jgi:uncharacterized protein YajQ (UPF0234 family)
MADNSFDIVSKVDLQEVSNAIQQALKEIHTRYDLKDSKSNVELDNKEALILTSADEFKLKAVNDVLQSKLVKRNVPLKALEYGTIEQAAGNRASRLRRRARSSKSSRTRRRKYRRRSREIWFASAAKTAIHCRKSWRS